VSQGQSKTTTIEINAPAARVFAIMADVERWHEWTASITSVQRLEPGPLRPGARARIRQPKFPPALWTVTAITDGHRFTWQSVSPGLKVVAHHVAEPISTGTRATLTVEFHGLLGGLWKALTGGITQRYIDLEAAGLKARAEERVSPSTDAG
jgi:uncharacterized membrane protein